ncbi:MAG: MupA/Atu3671 family FMN-dependent luciferase-like monooxygenase, partial [Myxococcaceae bacterium]
MEALPESRQRGAPYELMLSIQEAGENLTCCWTYNADLFDASTIARLAEHFVVLLQGIVDAPERAITELPLLTRAELLEDGNDTAAPYAREATVARLFEEQARRTPDWTALVAGEGALRFDQLEARCNLLAWRLRELGVGPESRVGVCAERSLDMVVALLAILKAGGAYVPLDPAYPAERLALMMEDSGITAVLTRGHLGRGLARPGVRLLELEHLPEQGEDPGPPPSATTPDNLAYIIYTSGSTGRPKGVMLTHRNVTNLFAGLDATIGETAPESGQPVWLAVTSISFDISVLELLWTLCRGYKVVVQQEAPSPSARRPAARPLDFSLFYFAAAIGDTQGAPYRLLLEGARFADRHGFKAVWVPERHFHEFGGLYPNPSVAASAMAAVTERVEIRAGSVVLPLHDPLRVVEEWAMVDNLSRGRVGLSFAAGWQPNDFVLAPERFTDRRAHLVSGLETVRRLWRGEKVKRTNGAGVEVEVQTLPRPVQPELRTWLTAAGNPDTFRQAGESGANLLTHLLGQNVRELAAKIALYREARARAGFDPGTVTLMVHTFVGEDPAAVHETIREPFKRYLRSSLDLMKGLSQSLGLDPEAHAEVVLEHAFQRYVGTSALFGTPDSCLPLVKQLQEIGVDEIACLIDFGVDQDTVLGALDQLDALRILANAGIASGGPPDPDDQQGQIPADVGLVAQVGRHAVTHLQCTPSMAAVIAADRSGLGALASLQQLMLGGEALPPSLVDEIRPAMSGGLLNMYGPTETTIWSTVSPIEAAGEPITIGRPIANTQVYIVDPNLQQNPIGAAGELLIGGAGVVRGYLDRPELTAERFVDLSAAGGARVYRTGDLVTLLPDGELQFMGRLDHQVKVRGYRIELG